MATVDPVAQTRFWHSFRSAMEDISEGLSTGRATAADGHWTKWTYFCARVALDPLLISYLDPVPILTAFARDYRTGNIAPGILTRSGAYATAAGRDVSSSVVPGEGVEDGYRVLIRDE